MRVCFFPPEKQRPSVVRQKYDSFPEYAENITPQEELDKLKSPVETFFLKRDRGSGRPTKKERRQMDSLWDALSFDVPDDVAEKFAAEFGFDDEDDENYDENRE